MTLIRQNRDSKNKGETNMNMQTVNELTHLYVTLNPYLSAKKDGSPEVKETNPTSLRMKANLDGLLIWGENMLIKIGLVSDFIKRTIKKHGELNDQKKSAS
jgi:hypothetical protein